MLKISDYLKIQAAADYVGVTPFTIRRWEREGKLRSYKNPINKYRLYLPKDLDEVLRNIENTASQDKK